MPGPPPSENVVRRNARIGPVRLPSEGRKGPTPPWPLPDIPTPGELAQWATMWALPQAVEWERLRYPHIVARYCRMVMIDERDLTGPLLTHILALEDRLGLTPKAMRNLLWTIAVDEVAVRRDESGPSTSARGRLKAVG